ncbi:MAG: hypothetical protein K2Q23_07565 [Bryobacteraceae bacterium]|nr:hypothetical protein [Bryobacteraceae bacterium]
MSHPASEALSDYCLAALLRCHRSPQGKGWESSAPQVGVEDREELLLRWALSDDVKHIAEHVYEHPRDIRSAIAFDTQTYSGSIPGAVDARATLLEQERTGDTTIFVCSEPTISPLTRRNHVLAWALREAESLILAAIRRHKLGSDQEWIHSRAGLLERAARAPLLREVMMSPMGRRRPNGAAIRDARKSLSPLYRRAAEATLAFEAIERLDSDALRALLSSTLVSGLEDWQRLELSTGLAAAEALSLACGEPVRWKCSITGGSEIANVGPYRIHWQSALPKRADAQLDVSEMMTREAAEALGAGMGLARSDISVRDIRSKLDIAHLECKWFGSPNSASSAIAEAVAQLVRYCRDSRPTSVPNARELLRDSVVVCAVLSGFTERADGLAPVGLLDFAGLIDSRLNAWAQRLHAKHSLSKAA